MLLRTRVISAAAAAPSAAAAAQLGLHGLPSFQPRAEGTAGEKSWRLLFTESSQGRPVSCWHDLPLRPSPLSHPSSASPSSSAASTAADPLLITVLTEIPRGTRAKMELCKEEAHNPIKQDVFAKQDGAPLRFFRYGDMPFNYGFVPRTWEDPAHVDPRTQCIGDGDPVDVVHLGPVQLMGQYEVACVLGVLGLIDQGETDWKIIVEPAFTASGAENTDGYGSLAKVPQDVQATILDWFENYKLPDGKPKNEFAFNKEIRSAETALEIIAQCATQYDALMRGDRQPPHPYWLR